MQYYHGYRALLNHPCVIMRFDYDYDGSLSIENIDEWLTQYVGIQRESLPDFGALKSDSRVRETALVFSRALALYGEFVSISGIPCSKPGRVVGIRPPQAQDRRFQVTLALPAMDNLPFKIFFDIFHEAFDLVETQFTQMPDRQKAEELLQRVQESTIGTFEKQIPFRLGSQSILDLVQRQNVPYRHLGIGIVRLGWGSKSRILQRGMCDADSMVGKEICGNKQLTSRVLRTAGFPGAENVLAPSEEAALAAAEALGWPVVVKPPHRERSEGVTTNITNRAELSAAYRKASEYHHQVLVERHAAGDCHRIFVANDRIIYVVRRMAKAVYGDGARTVAELVDAANLERLSKPPWRRLKIWPLDELAGVCLAKQGLTPSSVPEGGRRVKLRDISSNEWGGETENLTSSIHPDNVRLAIEVTRLMGISICGVDLITTDIARPWHETGAIINELNFCPEFRWWDREENATGIVSVLIENDGRIPVHVVTGWGDLLAHAKSLKGQIDRRGQRCHLTTATYSEDAAGSEIPMIQHTLFGRSLAMVMRPDVDALVIAGSEAELLEHGFAVDRLESVTVMDVDRQRAQKTIQGIQAQVAVRSYSVADS